MRKKTEIVKPFEFSLKINDHIICQRFFNVKNYNSAFTESYELKEMMDDIMGINQDVKLGLLPEFFKYKCISNSYKPYSLQNNNLFDKDDLFTLEVSKNNVNKLKELNPNFKISELQREIIATACFNGNIFHPNVRYEIDIRSIIPDIIRIIQRYMGSWNYSNTYGGVELNRLNKLSVDDLNKIEMV